MKFEQAKWIWKKDCVSGNDYVEFCGEFTLRMSDCRFRVCVSTNYVLSVNGMFAGTGQYEYFDGCETAEILDVSEFCKTGLNRFLLQVNTKKFGEARKGAVFEMESEGEIVFASGAKTRCRKSGVYRSGGNELIGNGIHFVPYLDLRHIVGEGLLPSSDAEFSPAEVTGEAGTFALRPIVKQQIAQFRPALLTEMRCFSYRGGETLGETLQRAEIGSEGEGKYQLYDLGEETVGYFAFEVTAVEEGELRLGFGEHLADGRPRTVCGTRNYALSITLGAGKTSFCEYFWRHGLRYISVYLPEHAEVNVIGVKPTAFPVKERPFVPKDEELRRIYEVSVHTLRCCMHEHYEDCPMREQAMYTMDSRVQMLCGYEAFEGFEFQKAAILLMSRKLREDGNLFLMQPGDHPLFIPTYTLVYFLVVRDYLRHTGDENLVKQLFPKLSHILNVYVKIMDKNGLIERFGPTDTAWHFYSWKKDLINMWGDNPLPEGSKEYPLILNCYLALALDCYSEFCTICGDLEGEQNAAKIAAKVRSATRATFWQEEKQLFASYLRDKLPWHFCELSQIMAIYCGVATPKQTAVLLDTLTSDNDLEPLSLNDFIYKYEILLAAGKRDFVERDIRARWGDMLAKGATSFWETEMGASDFDGAGSLCHGWSAAPIWCFKKMLGKEEFL